jgi:type VI secretion system secreted protein Hcp
MAASTDKQCPPLKYEGAFHMAIYIEYEGIKGNVTADGFADHIKVLSLNFGVGRGISMEAGHMANRELLVPA